MELQGKYGQAIVFTEDIESVAREQIVNLLNQPFAANAHVRIMPDCHAGAGCVIGYTARLTSKVVPNLIGVDIGCGVAAWNLGPRASVGEKFDKLDAVIRQHVPSGRNVRKSRIDGDTLGRIYATLEAEFSFTEFTNEVNRICKDLGLDNNRVWASIGSLGGGNHFIEIDASKCDDLWLVIHSGSRNFGLAIAKHHQRAAEDSLLGISKNEYLRRIKDIKKKTKGKGIEAAVRKLKKQVSEKHKTTGLEFVEGKQRTAYFRDMKIAQIFAKLSRRVMAYEILRHKYGQDYFPPVESVHNYIDFKDKIIRKGAISAHDGEEVVIPLNMADGLIYGVGKGVEEWNFSAPHGAGRRMSRTHAKKSIPLEEFRKRMKDSCVWSTCVGKHTLDEAPQAYKRADSIIRMISLSVDIRDHMKPVYNFKASE